ncbi:MAG: GAF domain-containing sensor histidine kinase [Chloroflexi bacterium]|nr:GAF domain-containing sensor histidine kinase [Chloroflexota bacterium]
MDAQAGLRDLRRLKRIGIAAPIVFLAIFELCRAALIAPAFEAPHSNLVAAGLGVAFALAFGLAIFLYLERAQRHVIRRNRDLAYVDAVATAIQGDVDVDGVVRHALDAIVESTGATEARATIHPLDAEAGPPREVSVQAADGHLDALATPDHLVELPLSTSAAPIGRVHIRLPAARLSELPSSEALSTAAHQVAAAVQIAQLVSDLQRRKNEGHTLYQALLQISNHVPLADTLTAIVEGARERLVADEGRLCLSPATLEAFAANAELSAALADGLACELPSAGDARSTAAATRRHRCPIGDEASYGAALRVPIWAPGELLGELWIARRTGEAFSERDRRYLMTLAGIAAIAITSGRLRERDRQGAILAERDRIARELHDSLAQVLGSNHLRLRTLLARPEVAGRGRISGELEDLAAVNEEAYRDVREAILGLREASRTQGLVEALGAYIDKYAQQSGLSVEFESTIDGELALPAASEIQVIRVIQEALTNVRKHARATTARGRIASGQPGTMAIVVEDDGRGFDPDAAPESRDGGYGLQTMRERMQLAGGSLRIDSGPGRGTRIIALVPDGSRGRSGNGAMVAPN